VFVYGLLRGLARNLANKNRIENPRGFSKETLTKQWLIHGVPVAQLFKYSLKFQELPESSYF